MDVLVDAAGGHAGGGGVGEATNGETSRTVLSAALAVLPTLGVGPEVKDQLPASLLPPYFPWPLLTTLPVVPRGR